MKRPNPTAADSDSDSDIGPAPPPTEEEATKVDQPESASALIPTKKRKILEFEDAYLRNIPSGQSYEKSFMHRDVVTHVIATVTDFIITASCDGHIKFWKKQHREGIEFVKHFRTHLGPIVDMVQNCNGSLLASISTDKSLKVFDVPNFDMINMLKLGYEPSNCSWVHQASDPVCAIAISEKDNPKIFIYDGKGSNTPIHVLDSTHRAPIKLIEYNSIFDVCISVDSNGILEYWGGPKKDYEFPSNIVTFDSKLDTDLFQFAKDKHYPTNLVFSPDGRDFATWSSDRKLRIFRFVTGKLSKVIDESLQNYMQEKGKLSLTNVEFSRRMAVEKELDKTGALGLTRLNFDESGNFILCPSLLGVKVINITTNKCVRIIGKPETLRFLGISLCRAIPAPNSKTEGAATSVQLEASDNPALRRADPDPMLVCAAHKKNRLFLFTNSEPFSTEDGEEEEGAAERDVFNEKPRKEDIITAVQEEVIEKRLCDSCIIHTTKGDVHCKLFFREAPKSVENFCTHARTGYYNGHMFHRVIKSFMIQTGDPTGSGMGGESIWGGEFEDEFDNSLKHDKPYTLSMANAGPNTNGSQFFITVVPTPWLDNKHTIFGRVTKGMDVCQNINNVRTNMKTGRPYDEISVISITLK